ncbi:hypothetical protein D3C72_1821030 [compost metagenome]
MHSRRVGHIGLQGHGVAAVCGQFGSQCLGLIAAAGIVDDHGVAVGGQAARDGSADATGAAGDQGDRAGSGGGHGRFQGVTPGWRRAIFVSPPSRIIMDNPETSSGRPNNGQIHRPACVCADRRAPQLQPCRRRPGAAAGHGDRRDQGIGAAPGRAPAAPDHARGGADAGRRGLLRPLSAPDRGHGRCRSCVP